ncbi:hypothetical protein V2J09_017893 [Rumex salicifolius]
MQLPMPVSYNHRVSSYYLFLITTEEMAKRVEIRCICLMVVALSVAYATDPTQLQDFCVAVSNPYDGLFVNGLFCKNPMEANPDDFTFNGLNVAGNTDNKQGSNVTLVSAMNLGGLNTLGISVARIDFAPYGLNPLHTHPRATEVLTLLEGTLLVGFVTSNLPNNAGNKLFAKILYPGDVFVFPQGLIHFQFNVGRAPAVAFASLSSQNPGVVTIANAVFGSQPPISLDVLAKSFQVDPSIIKILQSQFASARRP